MCGIVGVLGNHEAAPILVEALKRLEYRGYDSAGIATIHDLKLDRRRAIGKLVNLSDTLVHDPLAGKAGIGHTRWATHGAPNVGNAHPHRAGGVAVVHNGIIENFRELRSFLADQGIGFETDTDTETVALLADYYRNQGLSPRDAAEQTIARLEGAYALCFLFDGEDDLLIAARKGSPLAIGYGEGEMFVGSDAIALAPMTDRISYLEEGDWAVITRDSLEIRDANGAIANRAVKTIQIDTARVDKAGFKHFMAKEIAEQPAVLQGALSHYIAADGASVTMPEPDINFTQVERMTMVACGTAFYACLVAKYWFEQLAGIPVEVDVASEFRYREPPVTPGTVALFVSQSGETADTLAALRYMEGKAAKIVSVVNVPESSIARESDLPLPILAGTEIGVASTKAFTCQLTTLAILALRAAHMRGKLSDADLVEKLANLRSLPGLLNVALGIEEKSKEISRKLAETRDILFLGRGAMYPLALEGALKLKEISYIHAEAYASGELKHGPIALVDKHVPVIVMAPRDSLFDKTVSNMQEVMARGGKVLLITDQKGADEAGEGVWDTIIMPEIDPFLAPILYAIPAQLLAYHTAVAKGTDVDQPRNLAKSVTVEMTTPKQAIGQLRALGDPVKAAEMHKYHKIDRPYLGVANPVIDEHVKAWRAEVDLEARLALAKGLWKGNTHEGRIAAAKLLTQARIRPDDTGAWDLITSWVPEFDAWAVADHVSIAGQKRLVADPARLDTVETWTTSDHMWTRRAALVMTLPWTKQNHPKPADLAIRDRVLHWAAGYVTDHDWFIQKAVAWWLRELSKHDPDRVRAFLDAHQADMKPFAVKEAARKLP